MRVLDISSLALLLTAPALAQSSSSFTSPPGYLTTEGRSLAQGWTANGYSYLFGNYANSRCQFADGQYKSKGAKFITKIGYRLDYRSHSTSTAMGRTWTNVTLNLADCDYATFSSNFAANIRTTPSQVFNSAVTWPSAVGNPGASSPAPWDTSLSFPCSPPWIYTGTYDILQDFKFTGGTLANSGAWSGSGSKSYYLDALFIVVRMISNRTIYNTSPTQCRDSSITTSGWGYTATQYAQYSKIYTTNPAYADKVVIEVFSYRTAPNALVINAVSLGGSTSGGIPIGAKCNNLIIDLTQPHALLWQMTNSTGAVFPWTYIVAGPRSVINAIPGLEIWGQGAWMDSVTNQFALTTAYRTGPPPPNRGMTETSPLRKMIYHYNPTSTTGFPPDFMGFRNPIVRYN